MILVCCSTAANSGTQTLARCRADPGRTLCDSVRRMRMAFTMLPAVTGPDGGLRTCIRQACLHHLHGLVRVFTS